YDSTLTYTHSSDLKSMEELFGVSAPGGGFLGAANTPGTNDLSDLFKPGALTPATLGGNAFRETQTAGVFDPSTATWYLHNVDAAGAPDAGTFQYGGAGWDPIVGDWTGTGHLGVGVFDPATATWYLRSSLSSGAPDVAVFQYGGAGWIPVVGDWG